MKEKGNKVTQLNGRKGWKIMTEDGESLDSNALRAVVEMIKEIEYQVGRASFAQCFVYICKCISV